MDQPATSDFEVDAAFAQFVQDYSHDVDLTIDCNPTHQDDRTSISFDIGAYSSVLDLEYPEILSPWKSDTEPSFHPTGMLSASLPQPSPHQAVGPVAMLATSQLGLATFAGLALADTSALATMPELSSSVMQTPESSVFLPTPTGADHFSSGVSPYLPSSNVGQATDGDFQFESRAVVVEDRSRRSRRSPNQNGFKCTYPGCRYRGSFKRRYELHRHMKKHTEGKKFPCPALSCSKTFYRVDKIQQHLRQAHADGDEAICPLECCDSGPLPWELMKIHSHNHERGAGPVVDILKDIDFAGRRCPIPACQCPLQAEDVQAHLLMHSTGERKENDRRIRIAGYDPATAAIICPACQDYLPTVLDFVHHMESTHLVTDAEHFRMFRDSLRKTELNWGHAWYLAWQPQPLPERVYCSYCSKDPSDLLEPDHHVTLLRDYEGLRPIRLAILKLWPEFAGHPLFDDVLPKVLRREWRWVSI